MDPHYPDEPFERGVLHYLRQELIRPNRLRELRAAIAAFGERLRRKPDDTAARGLLCITLFEKARTEGPRGGETRERAEAELAELEHLAPDSVNLRAARAIARLHRGRPLPCSDPTRAPLLRDALADVDFVLRKCPDSYSFLVARVEIRAALQLDTTDEATCREQAPLILADIASISAAGVITEDLVLHRVSARFVLWEDEGAPVERRAGYLTESIEDLNNLLPLDPQSTTLHGQIACHFMHLIYLRSGAGLDFGVALKTALGHIAESHPEDAEALSVFDSLESGFLRGLAKKPLPPGNTDYVCTLLGLFEFTRSRIARRRGQDPRPSMEKARGYFERAIADRPGCAILHADLAQVLADLGEEAAARTRYQTVRQLDPKLAAELKQRLAEARRRKK